MAILPPQLPFEIITDILSRLPVRPLLRFKCVCKSWCSMISNDPQFAETHLQYAKQDTNLNSHKLFLFTLPLKSIDLKSYCNGDGDIVTRELNFPPGRTPDSDVRFVESCNGLISIVFDSKSDPQIIVWNPSTGESRDLPSNSFPDGDVFFGFGYDSSLDDYKIVRGSNSASSTEFRMEVFSLKGSKWRKIHQNLHSSVVLHGSATFLDGVLYWIVKQRNDPSQRSVIVSFDLAEEKFLEIIPMPDYVPQNMSLVLKLFEDFLCLCATTYTPYCETGTKEVNCEAWTIEGHGTKASWSRLFKFNSEPLPGCKYWLQVIWVAKNGDIVFNLDGWELVLYNPKDQTSKQYRVSSDGDWFLVNTYIESLISPNSSEG